MKYITQSITGHQVDPPSGSKRPVDGLVSPGRQLPNQIRQGKEGMQRKESLLAACLPLQADHARADRMEQVRTHAEQLRLRGC